MCPKETPFGTSPRGAGGRGLAGRLLPSPDRGMRVARESAGAVRVQQRPCPPANPATEAQSFLSPACARFVHGASAKAAARQGRGRSPGGDLRTATRREASQILRFQAAGRGRGGGDIVCKGALGVQIRKRFALFLFSRSRHFQVRRRPIRRNRRQRGILVSICFQHSSVVRRHLALRCGMATNPAPGSRHRGRCRRDSQPILLVPRREFRRSRPDHLHLGPAVARSLSH